MAAVVLMARRRPRGFVSPAPRTRPQRSRRPHRRPKVATKLCKFDVDTNTVFDAVTRKGEVDWQRVKRFANRYPDDGGLGTMIRTFIWETAKAARDGNGQLRRLARETRRFQSWSCAKAGPEDIKAFKRKFPIR